MSKVEIIGKQIFLVAYWYGEYDGFHESILGMASDYKRALAYAEKMAKLINNKDSWRFYKDSIVVKKLTIDKSLIDGKLIHSDDWGDGPETIPFKQKYIWKLDESKKKLINVENRSEWEEWS
ncbi:hypothetical protein LMB49_10760 [Limosilactobacillus reuteri]|uniref:hypothetical protein n=1 Tax=Limosilactobacillus reuteri TaxID=1598 RepID=UPI001E6562AF|nr:hypothetical protein [Limosilactobacillus reuteri]MCC4370559.1 hypothetical protein [Limosilactobacillus reuteri]MCC4371872.1 hypothetical protein [Limosilactobacillus reuteri]MCC4509343.1 hypothetical protein [Limosilactobacillus reuteri]MCC4509386.1 hypothetical protein [Limosilactobacillus reuteri]